MSEAKRIGTDSAGFSMALDAERGILRVRAWGFWSPDVATAFGTAVSDACAGAPKGTTLLIEMSDLKPMREEGQRSFGDLVSVLPKLGVERAYVITTSHLTKLQLLRIVAERGPKDLVQFVGAEPDLPKK